MEVDGSVFEISIELMYFHINFVVIYISTRKNEAEKDYLNVKINKKIYLAIMKIK